MITKYHIIATTFAKKHSVGDEVRSEASFIEGFNQACQFIEPDNSIVQCPKCNTAHVSFLEMKKPAQTSVQYPKGISARFKCLRCENEWNTNLHLSK